MNKFMFYTANDEGPSDMMFIVGDDLEDAIRKAFFSEGEFYNFVTDAAGDLMDWGPPGEAWEFLQDIDEFTPELFIRFIATYMHEIYSPMWGIVDLNGYNPKNVYPEYEEE